MKKILLLIIFISLIWADGGMMPPQGDYEIYSSDQVAIIKILPDSEELSILVKAHYVNDYNGFAWVIPLPSQPQVSEVDIELFTNLAHLTAPLYAGGGCSGPFSIGSGLGDNKEYGEDYYNVVSYDTIGFLGTVLIHTNIAATLTTWLNDNNYVVNASAEIIFEDYIDRNWNYFFVARADTTWQGSYENVGIRFKFSSDTLIYPMKISSISSLDSNALYLYVIGEHKMFFDDAELEYANKICQKELDDIEREYPILYEYINEGNYITKLKREYASPSEMSSDISIYQSPDDTEYHKFQDEYWYSGLANSMILPLLICVILIAFSKLKMKKRLS
jgi:hypothetical protein